MFVTFYDANFKIYTPLYLPTPVFIPVGKINI